MLVQRCPSQPTYCRSSSQMGHRAGVPPLGSNIVPHVSQILAVTAAGRGIEPLLLKKYLGVKIITVYLDVKIDAGTRRD